MLQLVIVFYLIIDLSLTVMGHEVSIEKWSYSQHLIFAAAKLWQLGVQ